MKGSQVVVAVLLIAVTPVYAQAKSRSAVRASNGDGVPNWDVSSSCRAAAKVAYTQDASARENSCMESENKTREKACCRLVDVSYRRADKVYQINRMV